MSNFTFLANEWPGIYDTARQVEAYVLSDARSAVFQARLALELAVKWLYDHDRTLQRPYEESLVNFLGEPSFKAAVPPVVVTKAHLIRKEGNQAVHSHKAVTTQTALGAAVELRHVLYWLARTYTTGDPAAIPNQFDEQLLPPPPAKAIQRSLEQIQALDEQLKQQDEALQKARATNKALQAQIAQMQAQGAARKARNAAVPDRHDYSEAETRQRIIDVLLREAGWDPAGPSVAEYPVTDMPTGNGRADYVLWGADGLPLAVVEAKRTSKDAYNGKHQAKLYADSLEKMHGRRPIIFYTNGYEITLWDDRRYPPRTVQGFYTQDELELLVQRRTPVAPLDQLAVNTKIVNRPYQQQAIRRMIEHIGRGHRKGLLVMATGTGKTRVAIALTDVLMRAGLVKRVLFLADRSALVTQTTRAFKTHLPASSPVNLTESTGKMQAPSARVVVSTYQTMLNVIDEASDTGQKLFGVGHFDLLIVDEAHRSVYQKFGAIFRYFDSLLVGLTATPKDEVDRNTYHLFELEEGVPTFAYQLEQAVLDGFLVPYQAFSLPTKFISQGIRYDDLSDEEQQEWELLDWGDSEDMPDSVDAGAINQWLFNEDTVDRILKSVMEHGLKVAGGDRLGKTIIFAKNHEHAKFIEQRFNHHYPVTAGQFARVIDYSTQPAQSLIDDFAKPASMPHIAISVDMLDTGVDIPEVVNLVFFKIVRSKTKFFQMIGRGTRLRPDLFGPGEPKTHFLIFDACLNFEFFNQNPQGATGSQPEPLSQTLFKRRLELLQQVRRISTGDANVASLAKALADDLHAAVTAMNTDNFIVRAQRQYVEPFQDRARWETLSRMDVAQLTNQVSGLPTQLPPDDETAKRFDGILIQLQLAFMAGAPVFARLRDAVIDIAANLETKTSIPQVNAALPLLQQLQQESFWQGVTLPELEHVRTTLRSLVRHVDTARRTEVYTTFADTGGEITEVTAPYLTPGVNAAQYRKKVEQFLRTHDSHPVIQKIRTARPLKPHDLQELEQFFYAADEVGGQAKFNELYGQPPNLALFVRSLVGLDRKAAKERFAAFLDGKAYTADQIQFVTFIIEHLTQNGTIDPTLLYGAPYTDLNYQGLDGLFSEAQADALLGVIRGVNVVVAV